MKPNEMLRRRDLTSRGRKSKSFLCRNTIKTPLVNNKANAIATSLPDYYIYDLNTKPGKTYYLEKRDI